GHFQSEFNLPYEALGEPDNRIRLGRTCADGKQQGGEQQHEPRSAGIVAQPRAAANISDPTYDKGLGIAVKHVAAAGTLELLPFDIESWGALPRTAQAPDCRGFHSRGNGGWLYQAVVDV